MKEFNFSTDIFFGEGALNRLRQLEYKSVMIVTDKFMTSMGVDKKIQSYLTNCQVSVFDGVIPDPPIEVVAEGVKALLGCGAESIIAVGGGSAIDAAKVIRAVGQGSSKTHIEFFAIPTTSGTGSEVTEYAVISDKAKGLKYPMDSEDLRPTVAILDPSLTVSAPPAVTADAGMDVLTHAIEAYVSTQANDFTDALCEKAISLVFRFLSLAYLDGGDLLAREKLHNASCMAGLAFNAAGLGVTHSIAHAVGGKLHVSHGRSNAMLLPHVVSFNANLDSVKDGEYSVCARKYQRIAKIIDLPAPSVRLGVLNLVEAITKLNAQLNIPATLKEWGADGMQVQSQQEAMIAAALADITIKTNPRRVSAQDVQGILNKIGG